MKEVGRWPTIFHCPGPSAPPPLGLPLARALRALAPGCSAPGLWARKGSALSASPRDLTLPETHCCARVGTHCCARVGTRCCACVGRLPGPFAPPPSTPRAPLARALRALAPGCSAPGPWARKGSALSASFGRVAALAWEGLTGGRVQAEDQEIGYFVEVAIVGNQCVAAAVYGGGQLNGIWQLQSVA